MTDSEDEHKAHKKQAKPSNRHTVDLTETDLSVEAASDSTKKKNSSKTSHDGVMSPVSSDESDIAESDMDMDSDVQSIASNSKDSVDIKVEPVEGAEQDKLEEHLDDDDDDDDDRNKDMRNGGDQTTASNQPPPELETEHSDVLPPSTSNDGVRSPNAIVLDESDGDQKDTENR